MARLAAGLLAILLSGCSSNDAKPPVDGGGTGGTGGSSGAPAMIESFTASAALVLPGEPVTLSWIVTGDEPLQLELDGVALPGGQRSFDDTPGETRSYRLVARNEFGENRAEVQVEVRRDVPFVGGIFPPHAEVEPGERQRFYATHPEPGESWTATCGEIPEAEDGTIVWTAPDAPASCRVRLHLAAGVAEATVVVNEAKPTVTGIEGMAGPLGYAIPFVQIGEESFVSAGYGVLMEYDLGIHTWRASLEIPRFDAGRIFVSPDGTVHALGGYPEGGYTPAWLRMGSGGLGWTSAPGPDLATTEGPTWLYYGTAMAPDGRICVSMGAGAKGGPVFCSDDGGGWSRFVELPSALSVETLGFSADGVLHVGTFEGKIHAIENGGARRLGDTVVPRLNSLEPLRVRESFTDSREAEGERTQESGPLHAAGEGVYRWNADTSEWIDLSAGLPRCISTLTGLCVVRRLVDLDDDLFALTDEGIFGKTPGGTFTKISDLPRRLPGSPTYGWLVASGSELWFSDESGLWRSEPWSGEWKLATLGGTDFGRHPTAVAFREDGTIAFAAESFRDDNDPVYLLRPGETRWKELGPSRLLTYHHVSSLAFREDGALAIGTNRVGGGVGTSGLIYLSPPGNDVYELLPQEGLPSWTPPGQERDGSRLTALRWARDGSLIAAIDGEGVFRLPAGAQSWAPLGPPLRANDLLLVGDRVLVASRGDVVELSADETEWRSVAAPRFAGTWHAAEHLRLATGDDGALHAAGTKGVFSLVDGEWIPVASGECSVSSQGVFAGGSRVYCAHDRNLAELHDGRWTRIPAIGTDGHRASAIEAGPDGALYLDFGASLRGAFVRTLP